MAFAALQQSRCSGVDGGIYDECTFLVRALERGAGMQQVHAWLGMQDQRQRMEVHAW